jgi:hypothetical protein
MSVPASSRSPSLILCSLLELLFLCLIRCCDIIFFHEFCWLQRAAPRVIRPDFTWKHLELKDAQLSSSIGHCPRLLPLFLRRVIGYAHALLYFFSRYYSKWFGIPLCHSIAQLPFGYVLKWADGTSLDEVRAMRIVRMAGVPSPRVISYGEHPATPRAPLSILMTRLPDAELGEVHETLDLVDRETIQGELRAILATLRGWKSPWGHRVCSVSGKSTQDSRMSGVYHIGPFNKDEFHEWPHCVTSPSVTDSGIVFTHGDLLPHNVMVCHGHVSGVIDWESAGWFPADWEITRSLSLCSHGSFWRKVFLEIVEDECEPGLVG